jgi:hypothetical protein
VGTSGMRDPPHGSMYRNGRPEAISLFFGQIACLDAWRRPALGLSGWPESQPWLET